MQDPAVSSLLQENSGETEQTSKAGSWCGKYLVGGSKERLAACGGCWSTTGSSTGWWCYVGWRGIEVDRDRGDWAAGGWDLDSAGRDFDNAGWDFDSAGWDFDRDGWNLYNAGGNLDGDDRGSGADDWDAASVHYFIASICHGDGARVWDRRAAGDGGNWGGVDNGGRDVCRRVAIFSN